MATTANNKRDKVTVVKGVTAAGEVLYPRLTEPDTKFNPEGMYSVKLRLPSDDSATQDLIDLIESIIDEAYRQAEEEAKTPQAKARIKRASPSYEEELDNNTGEPSGYITFNFKMKASGVSKQGRPWVRKPVIFDAKGNPLTDPALSIWGGSILKVAFELTPFNVPALGVGCSQKLTAVQVIELRSGYDNTADSYGFGVEEGFTMAAGAQTEEDTPFTPLKAGEAPTDGDF